jgi:hypothetical protein
MININNLQDIMPNEIIFIDYYKYIYLTIFLFLFFISLIFLIKRFNKKEKIVFTKEQIAVKNLKDLDFNTSKQKQLLYNFTLFAKECQNEKTKDRLADILEKIEPFKYQKDEIVLDENIKKILKEYADELVF